MIVEKRCQFCGQMFSGPAGAQAKRKYCGHKCSAKAQNQANPRPRHMVDLTCQTCGTGFQRQPSQLKRPGANDGRYCSKPCANQGQGKTRVCWSKGKTMHTDPRLMATSQKLRSRPRPPKAVFPPNVTCKGCGKAFYVCAVRLPKCGWCSVECRRTAPLISSNCALCGKGFQFKSYANGKYSQRFCSHACAYKHRSLTEAGWGPFAEKVAQGRRTDIEAMVEQVLTDLDIAYEFERHIGTYWVDFALTDFRVALECDGFYHLLLEGVEKDRRRDARLVALGWQVVHLPDAAIRADAHAAVLTALRDYLPLK